ncbi:unnamed protein product [Diamesa serratosioi]
MAPSAIKKAVNAVSSFFNDFLNQSGIHGFAYLGNQFFLHLIEKLAWLSLIIACLYFCVQFSFESWDRYLYKSTVVTIGRDHYYWNTSLPSITICPMHRISEKKYLKYVDDMGIDEDLRLDFFEFMESLANSTYINFENIKDTQATNQILKKLKILPENYATLIYNLTDNLITLHENIDFRVRNVNNLDFIRAIQVQTEFGICYSTNNFLAPNLSASWIIEKKIEADHPYYRNFKLHDVRFGNLFDGDMTYSFIGFDTPVTIFLHSPYEFINIARSVGYTVDAYEFEAYSIEIITTSDFKDDTSIAQRGCQFNSESNLKHFNIYSKGLCLQECRLNLAYDKCGCIPHFYPNSIKNPKPVCQYRVLKTCFPPLKRLFLEFYMENGKTFNCKCLQNCVDSNVVVEKFQVLSGTRSLLGSIGGLVIMKKYPLIRFQREVMFTLTDLFVSIGGTAGFFIGSSVLGIIEIVYFFSLRFFWYLFGYRRN